jgi:hypothetical protein
MTDKTIRELAQSALFTLNCSHPDTGIRELGRVLERLDPDSPDANVIQRAIDRLEEIAEEVAKVEYALADVDFTFGKLEV